MFDKLKLIFGFIKDNLEGKNTRAFIVAVFALLMYKILGVFGLFIGLVIAIGVDVCNTINFVEIFNFYKNKFFK